MLGQSTQEVSGLFIGTLRVQVFALKATPFELWLMGAQQSSEFAGPLLSLVQRISWPSLGFGVASRLGEVHSFQAASVWFPLHIVKNGFPCFETYPNWGMGIHALHRDLC